MEKQEAEQLDLSQWVIVHETPMQAWVGRLQIGEGPSDGEIQEILCEVGAGVREIIGLAECFVLTQYEMPVPHQQGMAFARGSNMAAAHELPDPVSITVKPRAITMVKDMTRANQDIIRRHIEAARANRLKTRAARAGIVPSHQAFPGRQ